MKTNTKFFTSIMCAFMVIATSSCIRSKTQELIYEAASLFDNGRQEDALRLYQKALKRGGIRAQPFLANCYMYGYGVEKNESKARSLYKTFSTSIPHPTEWPFVEVLINISNEGLVDIEGIKFEQEDLRLDKVSELISGHIEIADQQNCPFVVNIEHQPNASHHRILSVMEACSRSGIEFPFFFSEGLPPRPRMRL